MAGHSPTDEQLARRTLAGDDEAFDKLVRRHQSRVYHLAFQMCRDRDLADDWAQEAFVRAFEQLRRYDATRPFAPWLVTVATNTFLNQWRRRTPATISLDAGAEDDEPPLQVADGGRSAHELLEKRELQGMVQEAIARLPEKYRMVILLRHLEELEYEEIASAMQLPLGTVKTFLHRGREKLRQLVAAALREEQ